MGLIEIAGYYSGLKRGFDEIGVESSLITIVDHPFKYGDIETSNLLIRWMKRAGAKSAATPTSKLPLKLWRAFLFRLLFFAFFIWALLKHDAFIFGQMSSFYNHYSCGANVLLGSQDAYRLRCK